MDDPEANQPPGENFNSIDLSALQAFQFGTQWTSAGDPRKGGGGPGGPSARAPGGEGPARRDRRPPRRTPEGSGGGEGGGFGREPSGYAGGGAAHPQRERQGPGPAGGGFPGGQRREGGGGGGRFARGPGSGPGAGGGAGGGQRFERGGGRFDRGGPGGGGGDRFDRGPRRPPGPPRPYESPVLEVTFYPDDHGFTALVKAMRASCRTYELFEIARLILGKPERCVVVFRRRAAEGASPEAPRAPLAVSMPTGLPFDTEEEAINYALEKNLSQFFTSETVDCDPPKGTFQFVNRCPLTKELLGPPNYHRYAQLLQQHYTTRGIRVPFDRYAASVEVVRDPEVVNQWLESMKKVTRYTLVGALPEGEATGVFDNLEDARAFLLRTSRDRIVRQADSVRVAAKVVEAEMGTEAFRAMSGAVDMQRRFPLDTANALRGRLRRENFNIFKRGSKGVTYVCAVRRKFRQPGQSFSDTINRLIEFLDQNAMVAVTELPEKMLGFSPPTPPTEAPVETPAPAAEPPAVESVAVAEGEAAPVESIAAETAVPPTPAAAPAPAAPEVPALTLEQIQALNRLMLDLRWLVSEGYVAEYSDGRLTAHPVMAPVPPKPAGTARAAAAPVDGDESATDESAPTTAGDDFPASENVATLGTDESPAQPEAVEPVAETETPAPASTPESPAAPEETPPPTPAN